jgi:hypothetical protein
MREVFLSLAMLKGGNIFIKYSQHGPPHDRKVWLTVHESAYTENKRDADGDVISVLEKKVVEWVLRWADPEKATKGVLKEDTLIKLDEITAVSDGITSDVVKHQEKSASPHDPTRRRSHQPRGTSPEAPAPRHQPRGTSPEAPAPRHQPRGTSPEAPAPWHQPRGTSATAPALWHVL